MTEDDGIPEWARPLVRGPIKVDGATDFDELAHDLGQRLEALLHLYGCDATPDGWRALALRLALDHEIVPGQPAMRVITPVDRQGQTGGAEPGRRWWLAKRLEKRARKLGSMKAAAKEAAKTTGLTVGRLQNLAADVTAGRLAQPREMQRKPWEDWITAVLHMAADRVESGHDSQRLFS